MVVSCQLRDPAALPRRKELLFWRGTYFVTFLVPLLVQIFPSGEFFVRDMPGL